MTTLSETGVLPLKVLSGLNGQLEVYPDRLVIHRNWAYARQSFAKEETIYANQIAGIDCFEGRFLMNGSLRITLKEGGQHTLWFAFNQEHACEAREVRKLIEEFVSGNEPYPQHE
jgi:hypothetical protein